MKKNNKKLAFIVTNYQVSIWPLCMLGEMIMYHFYKLAGKNLGGEVISEWSKRNNRWAVNKKLYDVGINKLILNKIISNHNWIRTTIKKILLISKEFIEFTQKIFNSDLSKKTDKELYRFYMEYRKRFINAYIYFWFPNSIESINNRFTEKLENYLRLKLKKLNKIDQAGKYLSVLSSSLKKTNREIEEIKLLKIIDIILKNKVINNLFVNKNINTIIKKLPILSLKINKLIINHYKNYCWLPFDYDGPAWTEEYFVKKIKKTIKNKVIPKSKIENITKAKKKLKKLQKQFSEELNLNHDKKYSYLFELSRELIYIKDFRKDILFKSYYHIDKLIREISKRLGLSAIQVKHILPQEMEAVLLKRKYNKKEINKRIKYSILYYKPSSPGKILKNRMKIYTGITAKKLIKEKVFKEKYDNNINELKGQTAFFGKVKGKVRLIFTTNDIVKMRNGNILVSPSTNPNLLPAMRYAGAIITDKGGITCHAAITSRELKIPCIIGTGMATKILHDGDLVEVDADKGIIKILN